LNFSVHYDRAKYQERIGENDIKIRLTVWILRAKWWKTHFLKSWVRTWHPKNVPRFGSHATFLMAKCLVVREPNPPYYTIFHPFPLWTGFWYKHESFR